MEQTEIQTILHDVTIVHHVYWTHSRHRIVKAWDALLKPCVRTVEMWSLPAQSSACYTCVIACICFRSESAS